MRMTRQHFNLIAEVLRINYQPTPQYAALLDDKADNLALTNPKFNKDRFVLACSPV